MLRSGFEFEHLDLEPLLTVEDVAAMLKVKTTWVYAHIRSRCPDPIPHLGVGRYIRFELPAVRDWTQRQRKFYRPPNQTN